MSSPPQISDTDSLDFRLDDDEDGWLEVAATRTINSPRYPASSVGTLANNNDQDENDDASGWESVTQIELDTRSDAGSVSYPASLAPTEFSSGKRGRGRPPGIRGSHAFRKMMKEQLDQDNLALNADNRKESRKDQLARARAAKKEHAAKAKDIHHSGLGLGLAAVAIPKPSHNVEKLGEHFQGSMLELWSYKAALDLVPDKPIEDAGDGQRQERPTKFDLTLFLESLFQESSDSHGQADGEQSKSTHSCKYLSHYFKPYRGYCSISRDSQAFGVDAKAIERGLVRSASALKNLSNQMWGSLLSHLRSLLDAGSQGLLALVKFRFDETPSKIRGSDLDQTCQTKSLAKILQTELDIAFLLQDPDGRRLLLSGRVPTTLQVLDRQTAQNMCYALDYNLQQLPGLENVAGQFRQRILMFSTDEFSSNDLSQFCIQAKRPGWARISTLCDIHKASTCQGRVFDISGPAISAVINFALSATGAGSLGKLRCLLSDAVSSRFKLKIGDPHLSEEAVAYKEQVMELFLKIPSSFAVMTSSTVSSKQKTRYTQKMRQREVLGFWLNSDIREKDEIIFWAKPGQFQTEDEALQGFLKHVIPALLPCSPPLFPRNRWFGSDSALDFTGLLSAVHGPLEPLVVAWCGTRKTVPAQAKPNSLDFDQLLALEDDGWDVDSELRKVETENKQSESGNGQPNQGHPDDMPGVHASESMALVALEDGAIPSGAGQERGKQKEQEQEGPDEKKEFDWHKWNQQLRTSVADWISDKTGPTHTGQLALMRQFMSPILTLMVHLLYVSSKKWSRDQLSKSAKGQPRLYRLLLAHECEEARHLIRTGMNLFMLGPVSLPPQDWTQEVNVLCFTMISRLICSVHQLFIWRLRKYPYALFGALKGEGAAAAVFNDKRCLQDEVTQGLCSEFDSEAAFCSPACLDVIRALGILGDTDIGAIERQHAISRKIIQARSVTHAVALATLSADFMLRQTVQRKTDVFTYLYFDCDNVVRKLKRRQQRNAKKQKGRKRKRRGGGGAYRAFLSDVCRGKKATPWQWQRLAAQYRSLGPEQKDHYKAVGALGTTSHRAGFKSFGAGTKKAKKKVAGQMKSIDSNLDLSASPPPASAPDIDLWQEGRLVLFDPDKHLKEKFAIVKLSGQEVHRQVAEAREHDASAISSFLAGTSCLGEPPSLEGFQEPKPNSDPQSSHSLLPMPSSLPWMEWVPPADVFAQVPLRAFCSCCFLAFQHHLSLGH